MKQCVKETLCSGFFIRKKLCKVRVCSEYRVTRRIIRNAYLQVSEFDKDRIIAHQEFGLPFRDVALRTGQHPSIVMRICVAEGYTERHAMSQCPSMINSQEDRYIVRSAMQNRITISWTSQEMGMFPECLVFIRTACRRLQQHGLSVL